MIPHRLASLANIARDHTASATRAQAPEPDPAQNVHPQGLVERLYPYGYHADVVTTTVTWFLPFAHQRSIAPLGSGVTLSWPL